MRNTTSPNPAQLEVICRAKPQALLKTHGLHDDLHVRRQLVGGGRCPLKTFLNYRSPFLQCSLVEGPQQLSHIARFIRVSLGSKDHWSFNLEQRPLERTKRATARPKIQGIEIATSRPVTRGKKAKNKVCRSQTNFYSASPSDLEERPLQRTKCATAPSEIHGIAPITSRQGIRVKKPKNKEFHSQTHFHSALPCGLEDQSPQNTEPAIAKPETLGIEPATAQPVIHGRETTIEEECRSHTQFYPASQSDLEEQSPQETKPSTTRVEAEGIEPTTDRPVIQGKKPMVEEFCPQTLASSQLDQEVDQRSATGSEWSPPASKGHIGGRDDLLVGPIEVSDPEMPNVDEDHWELGATMALQGAAAGNGLLSTIPAVGGGQSIRRTTWANVIQKMSPTNLNETPNTMEIIGECRKYFFRPEIRRSTSFM